NGVQHAGYVGSRGGAAGASCRGRALQQLLQHQEQGVAVGGGRAHGRLQLYLLAKGDEAHGVALALQERGKRRGGQHRKL
nr:hypothetical protein [Tanacetum cinerariifolium]